MRFLMIANSFGVNLQTYAQQIAEANNVDLDIYVLYIGGCPLDLHERNIKEDKKDYELFHNGTSTGKMVSIKEALLMMEWDKISLQQASHYSGNVDTYYPYFEFVYNYVKELCPKSAILWHETWAYSPINSFKYETVKDWTPYFNYDNEEDMYKGIVYCLNKISTDFKLDGVIRSGDVVHLACKELGDPYDVQGFHMNELGCYLIGLNFIKLLSGKNINAKFVPSNMGHRTAEKCAEFINNNF